MHPLRETVHPARNHISIVTWQCTTGEPRNVRLLVQPVAKPFTTAHLTTLIFAPLINNPPLQLENAPPRKHQMLRPRKDLRDRTKQARVPLQNQPPWQVLKTPLLVLAGKRIQYSSFLTLLQLAKKTPPKHTGNIGRRSVRVLAARIVYKIGIISACPRSVQLLSANNWTASLLTDLQFSK